MPYPCPFDDLFRCVSDFLLILNMIYGWESLRFVLQIESSLSDVYQFFRQTYMCPWEQWELFSGVSKMITIFRWVCSRLNAKFHKICMNFVMLYTTHNVLCVSREVNKIAVNVCTSNYSNNTFFCLTRGNILKSATKVMNKKILLSQQPSGIFLKEQNFRLIIKQISMIFRKKTLKTF